MPFRLLVWLGGTALIAGAVLGLAMLLGRLTLDEPGREVTPPAIAPPRLPAPPTRWPSGAPLPPPTWPEASRWVETALLQGVPDELAPLLMRNAPPPDSAPLTARSLPLDVVHPAEQPDGDESFGAQVTALRRRPSDVVLVFDATRSMAHVLESLRADIRHFAAAAEAALPRTRIGIVAYRDGGARTVTETCPLTNDHGKLATFLADLEVEPGYNRGGIGDWAEAVDAGLAAAGRMNWRANAQRVCVIIGDAPPRGDGILAARREALAYSAPNRWLVALHADTLSKASAREASPNERTAEDTSVTNLYKQAEDAFRTLADDAGGTYATLADPDALGRVLLAHLLNTNRSERVAALWHATEPAAEGDLP